jgi:hypothetical protein
VLLVVSTETLHAPPTMRRDSTTAEPLLASPEPAAHYGTLPTADPDAAPPSSSPSKQSAAAETDLVAGTGSEHLGPYGGVIISLDKDPDAELPLKRTPWQQLKHVLQFVGAGSLIAVGYMDPGAYSSPSSFELLSRSSGLGWHVKRVPVSSARRRKPTGNEHRLKP